MEAVLGLLSKLEATDPELVRSGLELLASDQAREAFAQYLTKPIPALGGATCYEALAAGGRARVMRLFCTFAHGLYL